MAEPPKITVKFLLNEQMQQVVLAESDKHFVDVLLSFLTLPLGTVVKLLNKESKLGCVDNLYESVEKLNVQFFQTRACKTMLLHPRNSSAPRCDLLQVNIDDTERYKIYVCGKPECCSREECFYSCFRGTACCYCGQPMKAAMLQKENLEKAFIGGGLLFTIADDLRVFSASTADNLKLLHEKYVQDGSVLKETPVSLGATEILNILKKALISRTPLSDWYFPNNSTSATEKEEVSGLFEDLIRLEQRSFIDFLRRKPKNIMLKLVLSGPVKVVYAEADENVVDLLFSYLTFPLGSVIKFLNKKSSIGCLDNLYKSVEALSNLSANCKAILLSPKLPPHAGCSNQPVAIDEMPSRQSTLTTRCLKCILDCKECSHGVRDRTLREMDPRSKSREAQTERVYMKRTEKFMVMDDLQVTPLSPMAAIQIATKKGPVNSLWEMELAIGEVEALKLLRAALISQTPLTDAFASEILSKSSEGCPSFLSPK